MISQIRLYHTGRYSTEYLEALGYHKPLPWQLVPQYSYNCSYLARYKNSIK